MREAPRAPKQCLSCGADEAQEHASKCKRSRPYAPGIEGMGTDAPMAADGLRSHSLYRFDLVDPKAMFAMTKALSTGAQKYGDSNWRKIGVEVHVNHALAHLYAYLAGDTTDDHLTNALCRVMFARGVTLAEQ